MKYKSLKFLLNESVGDGNFELINRTNFQHLEIGNVYEIDLGNEFVKSRFVGWVDKNTEEPSDSDDPNEINLKFRDVKDGFEWEAYWYDNLYCAGSSAEAIMVLESY